MTVLRYALGVLSVVFALAGSLTAGGEKKISLAGDWEIVSMSKDGKDAPKEALENIFLRGTADSLVPTSKKDLKEDIGEKLEYKIDGARNVDLFQNVSDMTTIRRGIFEVSGDTVKICWSERSFAVKDKDGKLKVGDTAPARPANFDGGQGIFSAVLKRKAK